MLHNPGACPKCGRERMNMTSWNDSHEQYICAAGHREQGPAVDPADVARSKAEALAMLHSMLFAAADDE